MVVPFKDGMCSAQQFATSSRAPRRSNWRTVELRVSINPQICEDLSLELIDCLAILPTVSGPLEDQKKTIKPKNCGESSPSSAEETDLPLTTPTTTHTQIKY